MPLQYFPLLCRTVGDVGKPRALIGSTWSCHVDNRDVLLRQPSEELATGFVVRCASLLMALEVRHHRIRKGQHLSGVTDVVGRHLEEQTGQLTSCGQSRRAIRSPVAGSP